MGDSRAFGSQVPAMGHLIKGSGGLAGEIFDLRSDVDAAFISAEQQISAPVSAQSKIRLNTQPTATDTITVGANVYEFVAALGDETGSHIGVLRGANAAAALANVISAINNDPGSVASAGGTENVVASIYNTDYLLIQTAKYPGGPIVYGTSPSLALSDALTAAVNWDMANLNLTGFAGSFKRALLKVVVNAANLATDFDLVVPFTPYKAAVWLVTSTAGVPDGTGKSANLTLVQARNAVTIDLDGTATDPVATDIVYVEVYGL